MGKRGALPPPLQTSRESTYQNLASPPATTTTTTTTTTSSSSSTNQPFAAQPAASIPTPSPPHPRHPEHQHSSGVVDSATRHHFRRVLSELTHVLAATRQALPATPLIQRIPATFLLDWDDTCLSTTALEASGAMVDFHAPIPPPLATALEVLELRVLSLLKTAYALGNVYIVTNAGDQWVQLSASRFLPSVRAFLDQHRRDVKIISARARYAEQFPTAPLQWKARTFADELSSLYPSALPADVPAASVLVIGDSIGDQYAAHAAVNEFGRLNREAANALSPNYLATGSAVGPSIPPSLSNPQLSQHFSPTTTLATPVNLLLKVVKFLERPTVDQLSAELGVLVDHLRPMTAYASSFDVNMYNDSERRAGTEAVRSSTTKSSKRITSTGDISSGRTSSLHVLATTGEDSHSPRNNQSAVRSVTEAMSSVASDDTARRKLPAVESDYRRSAVVEHCGTPMEISC